MTSGATSLLFYSLTPTAMLPSRDDIRSLPVFAPLLAAILAPLSTLLDIPGLTEPWFFQTVHSTGEKHALSDPKANLALSAIGLTFNVLANALLILRFSVSDVNKRVATRASLACWVANFGIGLGNILAFGILTRNEPGISYGEAFWSAHRKGKPPTILQQEVRVAGRHFMLQNTIFMGTVGILALFMSRVEDWTYLQGIYFSVGSFLTTGFGDFYPTKAASQIVLFPFLLVGIVQLVALIDLIVRFFHERLASRHTQRRLDFEKRRQEEQDVIESEPSLEHELQFLHSLYTQTHKWKTADDLVKSGAGFLAFWILGALIFSQIEAWTYGQGLYFCYIFFFAVGYGDYAPITPAGRVVFIIYSLIAVPIMSSLAVQTIEVLLKQASTKLLDNEQAARGVGDGAIDINNIKDLRNFDGPTQHDNKAINCDEEKRIPEDAHQRLEENYALNFRKSHTDFIDEEHKRIEMKLSERGVGSQERDGANALGEAVRAADDREGKREQEEDHILTEYVLELAVELEKHARRLLLGHMKEGSNARILLKADRIVQLRNIRTLARQEEEQGEGVEVEAGTGSDSVESAENSPEDRNQRSQQNEKKQGEGPAAAANGRKPAMNAMMRKYYEEEAELMPFPTDLNERETLVEVARYREAFAGLLAAGSRLMRLKDEEKCFFERRLWKEGDKSN
ncbi:hypothetical protein EW145_g690 [Phellinidium pouzarii]|uniref:Potassium channel domain-containing protein n=1 Tax=Phellinidium pouzarii TaxID=167371 RepID=A0A4S4LHB5_9AGAM|nr:hypothetical protein EW145_g690 [Phellinidium pouzarii]